MLQHYKEVVTKALLDSRATGLFIYPEFAKEHGFELIKLKLPVLVRNVDGIYNIGEVIKYKIKVNSYYQRYLERVKTNVYNIGKCDVILGIS